MVRVDVPLFSMTALPRRPRFASGLVVLGVAALLCAPGCAEDGGSMDGSSGDGDGAEDGGGSGDDGVESGGGEPSQDCREVTMTAYDAGLGGMCQWADAYAVLPDFVQSNITLAIAEPFAGGSHGGEFAEACGECWEISTITATEIVMVTNLCPANADNPVCQGPATHFDLSREAGDALGHEGITIAQARPVPCPVTGNVHGVINARNDFFLRLAFANHRFTIRTAEYRIDGSDDWMPMTRDGGAFTINDANDAIGPDAPGVAFRLTSPQGDVLTGTNILPAALGEGDTFDLGAQFDERDVEGGSCVYIPDGTVYSDEFGGTDPVLWELNTYNGAQAGESSDDCAEGTSCIRVTNYAQWSGAVFRINDALPVGPYQELTMMLKAANGSGTVEVQVGQEGGTTCEPLEVEVGSDWVSVALDLTQGCDEVVEWGRIALINETEPFDLIVDEVVFR